MALFQDFPVGDWARKACVTEFWKGKSTSIPILKCFPTSCTVLNSYKGVKHIVAKAKLLKICTSQKSYPWGSLT